MSQGNDRHDPSRRTFLATAAVAASVAVIGLRPRSARAAKGALPHLTENADPLAKSFGYEPSAKAVNRAKFPNYKPGERCAMCRFFQGKSGEASGYAGCAIYPGYAVNARGWCGSFDARS